MYQKRNEYDVTSESYQSILTKLDTLQSQIESKTSFLGFDGYIDSLYSLCKKRKSPTEWTRMESMETFGELLLDVAGSSANVERVLKRKISGGFAPNSCKAMNGVGTKVNLVAALGYPNVDEIFSPIAEKNSINTISFSNPGETAGLEFDNGKVMLTDFENILNINWDLLKKRVGLDQIIEIFKESDILGFGHWSLIPQLGDIWMGLLKEVFPSLSDKKDKLFFVDLADLKKRNKKDIVEMLDQLHKINDDIPVMLSLNDQEAIDISRNIDEVDTIDPKKENFEDYFDAGKKLNESINIDNLIIHSPHFATITTKNSHYWVTEGFTSKPRYTTGAGDHFNSGTAIGLICNITPPEALIIGNALTAIFVRTGDSPTFEQLTQFINKYMDYIENDNPNFQA